MEAKVAADLPTSPKWSYEPKWDGFRAIIWRSEDTLSLESRNGKPLLRYFPELESEIRRLPPGTVADGEIVVITSGKLDFGALQNRIHPAASRIRQLSVDTPACVALGGPYAEGRRETIKVKHRRTIDCVVGGYRLSRSSSGVASLLLGLYDERGELHFIGHCSSFSERQSRELLDVVHSLAGESDQPAGFGEHARAPGGPSRWSSGRDLEWLPVKPELVIEVSYDRITDGRIRHGTRFERWRPDKEPGQCTMDQLERTSGPGLRDASQRGDSA
jgi:ATP-dependent DNA ligase